MALLIERQIRRRIEERLGKGKAIILTGPRRVGKTVLIQTIKAGYPGNSIFLNGEDITTVELLERKSAENYKALFASYDLLIIDEAQAIPEIGKVLKLIVDEVKGLDLIATGSSAFDLSNLLGEPLTGRKFHFDLFPFSQSELSAQESRIETYQRLDERLVFGTYPEVALMSDFESKKEYLNEIVKSYLLKDILAFERIKNPVLLNKLLQLLAYQVGSEVSLEELARQLGVHRATVERYLDLLSKVFVIFQVGGYSSNLRKEVVKSSKWYFYDNGIRNAVIGDYSLFHTRRDQGQLWENYLFSERVKRNSYLGLRADIFFWRTYDQQEIDMIERKDGQLAAFEFKLTKKKDKPPLFFARNYPDVPFQVVTRENYLDFIL
ncbi:MAG: ATP-binding protein [Saprospiraceae bacterium]